MQSVISFLSVKNDVLTLTVSANEKKLRSLKPNQLYWGQLCQSNPATRWGKRCWIVEPTNEYGNKRNVCFAQQKSFWWGMWLGRKLGLNDFHAPDFLIVHRLPSKKGTIPVVLVRFASLRITVDGWALVASWRPWLTLGPNIFLNEDLTPARKELLWFARAWRKEYGYTFFLVRGGKIFAKKL